MQVQSMEAIVDEQRHGFGTVTTIPILFSSDENSDLSILVKLIQRNITDISNQLVCLLIYYRIVNLWFCEAKASD